MANATLRNLFNLREKVTTANNVKCTCSGFVMQYDGCLCGKRDGIKQAEKALDKELDRINNPDG